MKKSSSEQLATHDEKRKRGIPYNGHEGIMVVHACHGKEINEGQKGTLF